MKRTIFLALTILLLVAFTNGESIKETTVSIIPESKLIVKGKTNINRFNCEFNVLKLKNPIPVFFEKKDNKIVFHKTKLILENTCFNCGNNGINKDFYSLLKSETHPQIILSLKDIKDDVNNEDCILANIDIEIAGVTKSYHMPITFEANGTMCIKGELDLNISDFNLKPPKKALGLIVVDEAIQIDFQLMVEEH